MCPLRGQELNCKNRPQRGRMFIECCRQGHNGILGKLCRQGHNGILGKLCRQGQILPIDMCPLRGQALKMVKIDPRGVVCL